MAPRDDDQQPFRVGARGADGLSRAQLRSLKYRSTARGVRVAASTTDDLRARCDALALVVPAGAAFSHETAALLYGAPLRASLDVHVSVPVGTSVPHRRPGMVPHAGLLPEGVTVWDGRRLTSPELTWLQLSAQHRLDELVEIGDAILRRTEATPLSMAAAVDATLVRRGILRAREALPLLRERVDSPRETRLRLFIVRAGLPCPETGRDAFDDAGQWFARPDLSYPALRIAIEYEGDHHRTDRRQYERDVYRDDLYDEHGWQLLKFTAADLAHGRYRIIRRVEAKLRAAGWHPAHEVIYS